MEWTGPDGFWISDDRSRIDVLKVHRWLSVESYWAKGRSFDTVARSIEGSITLGLFDAAGTQVGVCRWVTDCATFAWLCDVFVDAGFRGRGLGAFLVRTATEHPSVRDLRLRVLATTDAHPLYRRFGFTPLAAPERWMEHRH